MRDCEVIKHKKEKPNCRSGVFVFTTLFSREIFDNDENLFSTERIFSAEFGGEFSYLSFLYVVIIAWLIVEIRT